MIQREPPTRKELDPRPIQIQPSVTRYAEGSVLVQFGHTHVLVAASIEEVVPPWLKGKGQGWVTAEYNMLPRATHTRTKRERDKLGGRTQEIQRLIGRALRSCVDLQGLGERQIIVDCDVLQADGGTRTASITGACVALYQAMRKLEKEGKLRMADAWVDTVAAISVGMKDGKVLVDLDYNEDSSCDVDMNFVTTGGGKFIEIQGTGEHAAFSFDEMRAMTEAATGALERVRDIQRKAMEA